MNLRQIFIAVGALSVLAVAPGALAQQPQRAYDKTFLTNYDVLKPRQSTKAGQPVTWPTSLRAPSSAWRPTTPSWWTSQKSSSARIPRSRA